MILNFFITGFTTILTAMLSVLPDAHINEIPVVGTWIEEILINMVTVWNSLQITIPYFTDTMVVFIYAIIPFEIALLILKLILGNRVPANINY